MKPEEQKPNSKTEFKNLFEFPKVKTAKYIHIFIKRAKAGTGKFTFVHN